MNSERFEQERSPDLLDRASALTQQLNDASLERARLNAAPQQVRNPDGTWPQPDCDDCGDDIEPARLEHGFIRCVSCQTKREHRQKLGL